MRKLSTLWKSNRDRYGPECDCAQIKRSNCVKQIFVITVFLTLAASELLSESWTNLAGQVLVADVVSVSNRVAVFRDQRGRSRCYKISLFSREEQARMRSVTGLLLVPAALKAEQRSVRWRLKHIRQLSEAGLIDAEGLAARRAAALSLFEIRARRWYEKQGKKVDNAVVAEMKNQLGCK